MVVLLCYSNCSAITSRLNSIVVQDRDLEHLEHWHALNYNSAIKQACENTGSAARSLDWLIPPTIGGYIDSPENSQVFETGDGK